MNPETSSAGAPRALRSVGRALPWLLLLVQIVLCFQFLRGAGRLELGMLPDTHGYREAGRASSLSEALASHRTHVYPALLRFYDRAGRTWKEIPRLQAVVYFAAVVVFFAGLRIYSGSAWLALAAAIPLIYAKSHVFLAWAMTDSLSVSLTLVVFGLLFVLASRPASWPTWVGLTVAVLLSYHTRPSTLFLVGLVPALALVLRLCRRRQPLRGLARWTAGLAAATVLPYLLYALLRLVVVGHFGVVAFGGANLIGATATLLDKWAVAALPPGDSKVVARRLLDRRTEKGWYRMEFDIPAEYYFDQYNTNVWQMAVPVTRRRFRERTEPEMAALAAQKEGRPPPPLVDPRPRWIEQHQMMVDLSRALIRLRPYHYAHWVQQAWRYGLKEILSDGWIVWLLVLSTASLPLALLRRRRGDPPPAPAPAGGPERGRWWILIGLLVAAASYFLIHMTLVCMVSYPISRYTVAACVLWQPFLAAQLFELWRGIVGGPEPA